MPEGPSIIILKEQLRSFVGKKIKAASGYGKFDWDTLVGKTITDIRSWGKHLLIVVDKTTTIRIHLMMFGSYRINEDKETNPKIRLDFAYGKHINFYAVSLKLLYGPPEDFYDFSADIMSRAWSPSDARKKLKAKPGALVCDALLDQQIFSGSGNIIKNEVLFRTRIHPLSLVGKLPPARLSAMINETHKYAYDFLHWKKEGVLKKHWEAYANKTCPRCNIPLAKEYLGITKRRTFYCDNCQLLYH